MPRRRQSRCWGLAVEILEVAANASPERVARCWRAYLAIGGSGATLDAGGRQLAPKKPTAGAPLLALPRADVGFTAAPSICAAKLRPAQPTVCAAKPPPSEPLKPGRLDLWRRSWSARRADHGNPTARTWPWHAMRFP